MDFREETERWLEGYGYVLQEPVLVENVLYFKPEKKYDNGPTIQVTEYKDVRKVFMFDGRFLDEDLQISKGPIVYKHPKIYTFLEAFRHYNTLLEMYPFEAP